MKTKVLKKFSIPLYENGFKTQYTVDGIEGDEKWKILMNYHHELPIKINVSTKNSIRTPN